MWGVGLALVLVVCGIVLVVLGFQAQETDREIQAATLFKWMPKTNETPTSFLNCSSFTCAMDAPEFTSFYLWNLTNAEDLQGGGAVQPQLQQVGPYTYEKRTRKLHVQFHTIEDDAYDADSYGAVSYDVASTYHFSTERSNGSESDLVVTLNASYVRHLSKLHAQTGQSERFLAAEFAHVHIRDYTRHLQSDFVATTKLRALRALLPEMAMGVKRDGLTAVIDRQRRRVADASLPATLVRMHAVARTEQIPVMLRDVFRDQADMAVPGLLTEQFALARRQAVPRVLSNLMNRLIVEAVPVLLGQQLDAQQVNFVPRTLRSLSLKLPLIAFPYVLQEVFERACLETVPFLLHSIKSEIVALDMTTNQATADDAQLAVVNLWRQQGSSPTNFDAWIDETPTGQPRTGFELLPATSALELSLEVATLLLGSRPSNRRFSLVDYDPVQTAAEGHAGPQATAVGFALWKQVVALNETAIAYVLDGVNNDVARVEDYLTRAQLLAVREYILTWAQSRHVQRDRRRFWRQAFAKRTRNSELSDPDVDFDVERVGVQSGFSLQPLTMPSSATIVSEDVAQQVWNVSNEFAFVHPVGFIKWMDVVDGTTTTTATSSELLLTGITGMTRAEMTVISTWIKTILDDGVVRRRALLHWTSGTCVTVMQLPRDSGCLRYDLEPMIDGVQFGFEMNPEGVLDIGAGISESARDVLWDDTEDVSFLRPAHPSETTKNYARWLQAIRTGNYTRLVDDSQQLTRHAVTEVSVQAIGDWLSHWTRNPLNLVNVYSWWTSTCWPRETVSETPLGSPIVITGQATCTETSNEQEEATKRTSTEASLLFTDVRTYYVTKETCTATGGGSTYTKTQTTSSLTARVFSCAAVSTGLADDQDEGTTGFELQPPAQSIIKRISLAAAIVLWTPQHELSFRNTQGYKRWMMLAAGSSGNITEMTVELQTINSDLNAAIAVVCEESSRTNTGVLNAVRIDTSCTQVTTAHIVRIAAWVKEQSESSWVKDTVLDQWRRGRAGDFDLEPYRDELQSGLELTTGCELPVVASLSQEECSQITRQNNTQYEVPRQALKLWDVTHEASFLTVKGYTLWDSLASAVKNGDTTSLEASQSTLAELCGASSKWEIWMERVFQWLERWTTNEHLERDVLGHWLYAKCPTMSTKITGIVELTPQTSIVSSCTESSTITLGESLDEIQQLASRPVTFFDAHVVHEAALIRPTKTVQVTETWTNCDQMTASSFTQTIRTRQSHQEFQACNLLRVLATPDVDPSKVTPKDVNFELNRTAIVEVSIEAAQVLWDAQSTVSLVNVTSFYEKWYPVIGRSTALQTVQEDLNVLIKSSFSLNELSTVREYLIQWETSDTAAAIVSSLWISSNAPSVDVDLHETGAQRGFELYGNAAYQGTQSGSLIALPTLEQAKTLWKPHSVYSIVRSDRSVDDAGLPTAFRAWDELYEGVDYASEHLVAQYPLRNQVARPSAMARTLTDQKRAQLVTAMSTATTLSEAQIRGIARWLFNWATHESLRDFVLAQWATGETFRGDPTLSFDLASYVERLYSFPVTLDRDQFTAASSVLRDASRDSLRKLWDVATMGSFLDPASRIVWCLIDVFDSDGKTRTPCAHLLDGYGVLKDAAFDEFVALVAAPGQAILRETANLSVLALSFLELALGLTRDQLEVVAKWYRQVPEMSLFSQIIQLEEWSAAQSEASKDPLEFGYGLAFVLPWHTVEIARNVSRRNLVVNVAYLGANLTEKTVGECTKSLPLLYTFWDASNPVSFLHPTGISTWLSYIRGELDELQLVGAANPTTNVIDDLQLSDTTVSCFCQFVGHWLKSWTSHPSTRMFVEEFWIASITQPSVSLATLLPSASARTMAFSLETLASSNDKDAAPVSTTNWWTTAARVLLDDTESIALLNPNEGFALWRLLLLNCFSSDRVTGKCTLPDNFSHYEISRAEALKVLSRSLLDRIIELSTEFSRADDDVLLAYTVSMIQQQITAWLLALLDHTVLEQYVLERVRLANGDDQDVSTGPRSFVDFAAVQFVNGSVTGATYIVHDNSTGRLLLEDNGTRSERFPLKEFAFDAVKGVIVQQLSSFLPGFGELSAFCSGNGHDRHFAYDDETTCSLGTDYTLSISDAQSLWQTFGYDDTVVWSWPRSSAVSTAFRSALLVDSFLAQPFETTEVCQAQLKTVLQAYDNDWNTHEKQHLCVDRTGGAGTGSKAVYLHFPTLRDLQDKPVSFVQDLQAYLQYTATKFGYEPQILGLSSPRQPSQEAVVSSSLIYPIGGYFAVLKVSQILFASSSSEAGRTSMGMPLWPNTSATERGASTFELVIPLQNDVVLYKKSKSIVGRLLTIDGTTLMNAWGEDVELRAVRVTDGSQFTTAVLTGQGENSANSLNLPPQNLYFYWSYAHRVVQITFKSNLTRFGTSLMRYVVDWTLPSRLPTGIVSGTSSSPCLNMSFLYDDLPLIIESSSSSLNASSVVDIDPRTGVVLHRRLVWQLTAQVGDSRMLNVWHKDLAMGRLPIVWIEEEAGMSIAASNAMTNLGPFTAKTLSIFLWVGGACVLVVGCVVGCVSIQRARLIRMQRFHSIVPEATTTAVDAVVAAAEEEQLEVANGSTKAIQVMLDRTEGIEAAQDEATMDATTRAWLHRAPE